MNFLDVGGIKQFFLMSGNTSETETGKWERKSEKANAPTQRGGPKLQNQQEERFHHAPIKTKLQAFELGHIMERH